LQHLFIRPIGLTIVLSFVPSSHISAINATRHYLGPSRCICEVLYLLKKTIVSKLRAHSWK